MSQNSVVKFKQPGKNRPFTSTWQVSGGVPKNKSLGDLFEIKVLKAYKKPFTRNVEEGTYIANHEGIILNSKSEWHQPQIVRTRTTVVQGGADQHTGAGARDKGGRPGRPRREEGR